MHFAITGNANFVPTEGTATARVRLFLQHQGDTLTAQEPYKRWWSVPYAELREGESTLTVAVSPDQWSSVFGQRGAEVPNEFNAAISKLVNVGFTFGRGGPGCLNRISASISGASAGVRLPSGGAAG
jgi:hypothetical protein